MFVDFAAELYILYIKIYIREDEMFEMIMIKSIDVMWCDESEK